MITGDTEERCYNSEQTILVESMRYEVRRLESMMTDKLKSLMTEKLESMVTEKLEEAMRNNNETLLDSIKKLTSDQ